MTDETSYSVFSANIGLRRDARNAGMVLARHATSSSTSVTVANVEGFSVPLDTRGRESGG